MKAMVWGGVAAVGLATVGSAQGTACVVPDAVDVDPCIVGFWVGDNDAAERVNALIRQLAPAGTNRTVIPSMPAALGLIVTPDGAYVSMPFAETHGWMDEDEESLRIITMALQGSAEAGYLSAQGGAMSFCPSGDAVAWLDLGVTDTLSGSKEITIPIVEGAGQPFIPVMNYTCAPNYLQIDIMLPPPINRVQYRLGGVGAEAFGEYYSAAVLDRLRLGREGEGTGGEGDPVEIVPVEPVEVPIGVVPVEVPIPEVGSD